MGQGSAVGVHQLARDHFPLVMLVTKGSQLSTALVMQHHPPTSRGGGGGGEVVNHHRLTTSPPPPPRDVGS